MTTTAGSSGRHEPCPLLSHPSRTGAALHVPKQFTRNQIEVRLDRRRRFGHFDQLTEVSQIKFLLRTLESERA